MHMFDRQGIAERLSNRARPQTVHLAVYGCTHFASQLRCCRREPVSSTTPTSSLELHPIAQSRSQSHRRTTSTPRIHSRPSRMSQRTSVVGKSCVGTVAGAVRGTQKPGTETAPTCSPRTWHAIRLFTPASTFEGGTLLARESNPLVSETTGCKQLFSRKRHRLGQALKVFTPTQVQL